MKGDFTRVTFRREHHYRGVRWQQGRVQNEADDNEQVDIVDHRIETETVDTIGQAGVPEHDGGFAIGVSDDGSALTISAGRIYVGGLSCQLHRTGVTLTTQPDLPLTPGHGLELGEAPGRYLVYAEAWVRHLTAIEAPHIREVALGGPDTCSRLQTICQVKLLPLPPAPAGGAPAMECETFGAASLPELYGTGRLRASVTEPDAEATPCLVPPQAGYRRLENQLYRVEIHRGGTAGEATIKWSRDNGTVTFAVDGREGRELSLRDLGPDPTRSVDHRHLVELVDDATVLQGRTMPLLEVESVDPARATMRVTIEPVAGVGEDPSLHPLVRRWDHQGSTDDLVGGAIALVEGERIALEDGVEIEFEASAPGNPRTYRPGEHWLIPARTVTGDVEWPRDDDGDPSFVEPRGREPRVAALAVVERLPGDDAGPGAWSIEHDCRRTFVPAAEHVEFDAIGGDGQIILHEGLTGLLLPQALRVRVNRGGRPWAGARVRFRLAESDGSLAPDDDMEVVTDDAQGLTLTTDADGVAACRWTMGPVSPSQRVEAYLLRAIVDGGFVEQHPALSFAASYVEAIAGRCRVELSPGMDWRATLLDVDAATNVQDVAICFAPGRYELPIGERIAIHDMRSVTIEGAGMGTVLAGVGTDAVLELRDCQYVTVRDLFIDGVAGVPLDETEGAIAGVLEIQGAFGVEIEDVTARTATAAVPRFACIVIDGRTADDPTPGVCEVRVEGCNLTPGDEQIGLWVASCSRVTVEDNVVGHLPHPDRIPPSLTRSAKLANDVYANDMVELALRDLGELGPDEPRDGRVVVELAGGRNIGLRPHPELVEDVRGWVARNLRTLAAREPAEAIAELRRLAVVELRTSTAERSWGWIVRESMLATSTAAIARMGIVITGDELLPVTEVPPSSLAAGLVLGAVPFQPPPPRPAVTTFVAPATREPASTSPTREPASSSPTVVRPSATAPTSETLATRLRPRLRARVTPSDTTSSRLALLPQGTSAASGFRLVVADPPPTVHPPAGTPPPRTTVTLDLGYVLPGTVFFPRSQAEVRVLGNTVTHVRRGVIAEPRTQQTGSQQLGTVEITGNVVWIVVAVDGARQTHVGLDVGGAESIVLSRNRVQVDRPTRSRTDAMDLHADGLRIAGRIGPRLLVTENLLVADQRGNEVIAWDVGIRVDPASGSVAEGGGRLWRVMPAENAYWGDWEPLVWE